MATDRQVNSYLSRIDSNDPNRDLFMSSILPSLQNLELDQNNNGVFVCRLCNNEASYKSPANFGFLSSFIRHLTECHKHQLPCNGLVFTTPSSNTFTHTDRAFRCNLCRVDFKRKGHLSNHFESNNHLKMLKISREIREYKAVEFLSERKKRTSSRAALSSSTQAQVIDDDLLLVNWLIVFESSKLSLEKKKKATIDQVSSNLDYKTLFDQLEEAATGKKRKRSAESDENSEEEHSIKKHVS
jgi:hypothetical protein